MKTADTHPFMDTVYTPMAQRWLALAAVGEASIMRWASEPLLRAVLVVQSAHIWRHCAVATAGSVMGGMVMVGLTHMVWAFIGDPLAHVHDAEGLMANLGRIYGNVNVLATLVLAFGPFPYRVAGLLAGLFGGNILSFIVASVIGRGARYFGMGWVIWRSGATQARWLADYYDSLTLILSLGLFLACVGVKYMVM